MMPSSRWSPGAENVFPGIIHHTVYMGEAAQHLVDVPAFEGPGAAARGGTSAGATVTLKALELSPRIVARDTQEKTQVWMDPEDVVVLRT